MNKKRIIIAALLIVILAFTFMACNNDKDVDSLSLDLSNVNLELELGQDLDLSNLVVSVTNGGVTKLNLKSGDYTIDLGGFDKDVAGTYTIKVKYGTYQDYTFTVQVKLPDDGLLISHIEVDDESSHQTSFAYNEDFNYLNLKIKVGFRDGSSTVITEGFTVDDTEYNKAHGLDRVPSYLIRVNYEDKTTSYGVIVAKDPSKVVKSIAVKGNIKTQFRYYEDYSDQNLEVEVTMMDDSTQPADWYIVESSAFNKEHGNIEPQTYSIIVKYNDMQTTYDVTVAGAVVENIFVIASEEDKTFAYGDEFSIKNIEIYAQYKNSEYTKQLDFADVEFDISNYIAEHNSNYWDQEFEISVKLKQNVEVSTSYIVTMPKAPLFTKYRVADGSKHKQTFLKDEAFNSNGLVVEAVYGSDNKGDLHAKVVDATITCPDFDSTTKGYYQVFASMPEYDENYIYSVYVDIDDGSTIVSIMPTLVKSSYFVFDSIDLTGSFIDVSYSDNTSTRIYLNNKQHQDMVQDFNSNTVGIFDVTFVYCGVSEKVYNVSVEEDCIINIWIPNNSKHRTSFYKWDDFSHNGLIVMADWESGKTTTLKPDEYTINQTNYISHEAGNHAIEVTCTNKVVEYSVDVMDFVRATKPVSINVVIDSKDYNTDTESSNGQWDIHCSRNGDGRLSINLGNDILSTVSVMRGRWFFGDIFLPLTPNYDNSYKIYYDGVNDTIYTIKITDAAGNASYNYLTIKPEKLLFDSFTINGDEVVVVDNFIEYVLKDVSNTYVVDWTIDSKYQVDGITKGESYQLFDKDYGASVEIIIKDNNVKVATYNIYIMPYVLISSISVDSSIAEETEYRGYEIIWQNYDITTTYNYAIEVETGYSAVLTYRGVDIPSISGDILFAGCNEFFVKVKDPQGKQAAIYQLILVVKMNIDDIYSSAYLGEVDNTLNYNDYNVGVLQAYTKFGSEIAVNFDLLDNVSVAIKESDWVNGGSVSLQQGKNEFILIFNNNGYSYQVYLVIYKDFYSFSFGGSCPTVCGVETEDSSSLPTSDTFIIRIPNGYDYESKLNSIIDMHNDSFTYEYSISYNSENLLGEQIIITVKNDGIVEGYAYILVIRDGEVNNNTNVEFAFLEFIDFFTDKVEYTDINYTKEGDEFVASIEVEHNRFIMIDVPYFAEVEILYSDLNAVMSVDEGIDILTAEVGSAFTITINITASDGTTTAEYILTVTVVAAPTVVTLDFGEENLIEFSLMDLLMMQLANEEDDFVNIFIKKSEIPASAINEETGIVTFNIISTKVYTMEEVLVGAEDIECSINNHSNPLMFMFKIDENMPLELLGLKIIIESVT